MMYPYKICTMYLYKTKNKYQEIIISYQVLILKKSQHKAEILIK